MRLHKDNDNSFIFAVKMAALTAYRGLGLSPDINDYPEGIIFPVDKPYRWTSADVIRKLKWAAGKHFGSRKLKVGHAGTLDPLATGVLLVCVGKATKLAEQLQRSEKQYLAGVSFGATTPSYDLEKEIDRHCPLDGVSEEALRAVLPDFLGEQDQVAPLFSAKSVDGVRAYEMARKLFKQGRLAEGSDLLQASRITIYSLDLENYIPSEGIVSKAEGMGPENCATLGIIRGGDPLPAMGGAERSEAFSGTVPPEKKGKDKGKVFGAYSTGERTRSFLKVQDGCNNYCKYCTVPYARGESRNIPISECVSNAQAIAAEGVKEIVLTGVNTGDFGRTTGESFLDLLKALEGVQGIERYRISSIEPNLITEEIIDWIASGTKFQPHFHIPLQTGSDTLLKVMGRRYETAFFAERIAYIRSRMEGPGKPKVFFGIDTMVGLPGETEELFRETYDFIASLKPAFIHVFPYSRRPGTPAAAMPGQLPERVKHERVLALEELCARLHAEFVESNRGIPERVLFESKEKNGNMSGYTGNYIRIERPYDASLVGRLTDIII